MLQRFFPAVSFKRYRIGAHEIKLPAAHRLPEYQAIFPKYDRFLPLLAKHLPSGLIVDIGANVGDTAVALAQVCPNPILSIEGNHIYFALCQENIAPFADRLTCICQIVGTQAGVLVADGTTASLKSEAGDATALDALLSDGPIALIKTDTDGSDADVLLSGLTAIKRDKPLLYWENENPGARHEELYGALQGLGYSHLWIFDNFGNMLLADCGYDALRQINRYIANQSGVVPTIYYTDVLASSEASYMAANAAISALDKQRS